MNHGCPTNSLCYVQKGDSGSPEELPRANKDYSKGIALGQYYNPEVVIAQG